MANRDINQEWFVLVKIVRFSKIINAYCRWSLSQTWQETWRVRLKTQISEQSISSLWILDNSCPLIQILVSLSDVGDQKFNSSQFSGILYWGPECSEMWHTKNGKDRWYIAGSFRSFEVSFTDSWPITEKLQLGKKICIKKRKTEA